MKKNQKHAPVALFVYNRLPYLKKTVEALKLNHLSLETDLFIFSDGPKSSIADVKAVDEVREYVSKITGFRSLQLKFSPVNNGLAKSIVSGVTETLRSYNSVIVLEDDLVVAPNFLHFMNDALLRYELDERVMSISGYVYPINLANIKSSTFFLNYADCLGWATWRRGWANFHWDAEDLYIELKKKRLLNKLNLEYSYPYSWMLRKQFIANSTSWAVRWYASGVLNNKLTLFPYRSLVNHIGFSTGTHFLSSSWLEGYMSSVLPAFRVEVDKIKVNENVAVRRKYRNYLRILVILMIVNKVKNIFINKIRWI